MERRRAGAKARGRPSGRRAGRRARSRRGRSGWRPEADARAPLPWVAGAALPLLVLPGPRPAAAQQTVTLDAPSAVAAEPFSLVGGIRELPDGSLLVADPLEESLYRLAPTLGEREKVGRNGQGPREYRQPDALYALAGGRTLMVDLGNGRLATLDPEGGIVETRPIAFERDGEPVIALPRDVDRAGAVYFRPLGMRPGAAFPDSGVVARLSPQGAVDTLARVKLMEVAQQESGGSGERRVMTMPVPYSPQDGWAVTPDGRLGVVRAADYHVEWIDPDGTVTRGPPTEWRPVPIRKADREAWLEESGTGLRMTVSVSNGERRTGFRRGGGGDGGPGVDDLRWPEHKAPFDADQVRAAPDGTLWVPRAVPAGERPAVDVFDVAGRRVATVRLPPGRRLAGFGEGTLYLSRADELDFRWLERYERPL